MSLWKPAERSCYSFPLVNGFHHCVLPCLCTRTSVCAAACEEQRMSSWRVATGFPFAGLVFGWNGALILFTAGGGQNWVLAYALLNCSGNVHVVCILQVSTDVTWLFLSKTDLKICHVLSFGTLTLKYECFIILLLARTCLKMQSLVFVFIEFQLWHWGMDYKCSYVFYLKTKVSLELQILDVIFLLSSYF